jgi:glucose-1-phosphatase
MKPEAPVDIVCFDLGGVLIRICGSWAEACRAAGLSPPDASSTRALDEHRSLTALLDTGRIAYDEWAAGVSKAFGGLYSPDEAKRAHDAISQEELAGALGLVDALHEAGVATACLSNTNHAHWVRLVHHDASGPRTGEPEYPAVARLKRHFASHILGVAKPDPAIYAEFERLAEVRGDGIVFFDDRAENVDAARRRHWRAHRVDPERDPIAEVREHLRRYRVLVA